MPTEPDVEIPEYCDLDEDELNERRPRVEALRDRVEDVEELDRGLRLAFPGDRETLELAWTFAANERECCPWAEFELAFSGEGEPVLLAMQAPEDVEIDPRPDLREAFQLDCCPGEAA